MGSKLMTLVNTIHRLRGALINYAHRHKLLMPSLMPIVAAIATVLLTTPLSQSILISNIDLTVANPRDIQSYMSKRLLTTFPDKATVFNIGGSSLLRALDEDFRLEEQFGNQYHFANFTYASQSLVESLVILQKARLKPGDLVVLHINVSRLNNFIPEQHRICTPYLYTIKPVDIINQMREFGLTPSINPLCNLTALSRRKQLRKIYKNTLSVIKGEMPTTYSGIYPLPLDRIPEKLEAIRALRRIRQNTPEFYQDWVHIDASQATKNIEIISRIRKLSATHGTSLVLVDLPLNREWFEKYHRAWKLNEQEYRKIIDQIRSRKIIYHDYRDSPGFTFDDFYDHTHMTESGRKKFLPIYLRIIKQALTNKPTAYKK